MKTIKYFHLAKICQNVLTRNHTPIDRNVLELFCAPLYVHCNSDNSKNVPSIERVQRQPDFSL